jgi:hypothetical protein
VHIEVRLRALNSLTELGRHVLGDGIAPLRVVDGDHRDVIDNLEKNQIGHGNRG